MSDPSAFTVLLPVPFLSALFLMCENVRTTTGAKSCSSTRLRCGIGAPCRCSLPAKTVSVEFHQVHHRQDHTDARTKRQDLRERLRGPTSTTTTVVRQVHLRIRQVQLPRKTRSAKYLYRLLRNPKNAKYFITRRLKRLPTPKTHEQKPSSLTTVDLRRTGLCRVSLRFVKTIKSLDDKCTTTRIVPSTPSFRRDQQV
ncbi:hypothetical protein VPH35_064876 [Triticum aestivum]